MGGRGAHPFVIGRGRLLVLWPHIGPDQSTKLDAWIGLDLDARLQRCACGLGGHVDAIAVSVEFPAVIDAAHAAFLVAAKEHRRAAVRAIGIHKADVAVAVTECDQVFAQQAHAQRLAIALRHFAGHAGGNPISAKQSTAGRAGADACDSFIVFGLEHCEPPCIFCRSRLDRPVGARAP